MKTGNTTKYSAIKASVLLIAEAPPLPSINLVFLKTSFPRHSFVLFVKFYVLFIIY